MTAKLQLSAEEMRLVSDPAWILTKNSVMGKVVEMFGALSVEFREMLPGSGESNVSRGEPKVSRGEPKVSRGEQYKGLPWVMLDYPRIFGKEDVQAIRTMFWWGNYFTVALHLKGEYLRLYLPVILERWEELEAAGFRPGLSDDEWEHDHRPGDWKEMEARADAEARPFLKVAARCDLDQSERLRMLYGVLARVLRSRVGR
jgi:hypothetical protein